MSSEPPVSDEATMGVERGPRSFAGSRYAVVRPLGEGGQKSVFLVHDSALNRDCALALIRADQLEPDDLLRFQREAEAMARLGAHSNIVSVFDIGEQDGRPFLVSEFISGGDLRQHMRKRGSLPIDELLTIASDVARALAVAHGRGVVHRDVKPLNIWLTEDGTAKLGDFGLAFSLDRSRMTLPGTVMGTAAYMSPEQALGKPVTERSDLYALGCVLYEMVCGRPPFADDNATAVIAQHLNAQPAAPSTQNAQVPVALEDLILRLLAKTPQERPQTASGVVEELRRIASDATQTREVAAPSSEPIAPESTGTFVGRVPELAQLDAALARTTGGSGALVMLVGEPGIGKTRLIEEFARHAHDARALVLHGRCYDGDWAPPFSPFVEAIKQHAAATPPHKLSAQLAADAGVLARIVPSLHERLPGIAEPPQIPAEGERYRLLEAVSDTLGRLAAERPLVLMLDDLHWADKGTIAMLRQVARTSATQPLLLLGAYRDVELDRQHPLAAALADLRREKSFERILMRGLDNAEVAELLDAIAEQDVPAPLSEAIARETEGNPFFIKEVLLHLVEEGKIVQQDGTWTTKLSIAEMGIPEGVREVIGRRLSRVSDTCGRMLTTASALTAGFSWDVISALVDADDAALLDAVDEALAAQLIVERERGRYDFTHALIRHTLYEELSTPRRVLMHRQIGEALERLYAAADLEPHLAELAHHFFIAGGGSDPTKAVTYIRRAGQGALDVWAHEEAGRHFERGLELFGMARLKDEHLQCQLLVGRATAETRYDPVASAEHARECFDLAKGLGDPELIATAALAHYFAVNACSLIQEIRADLVNVMESSLSVLASALDSLPPTDSWERSQISASLSRRLFEKSMFLGSGGRGEEFAEQARALAGDALAIAERLNDPEALIEALSARFLGLEGPDNLEQRLSIATRMIDIEQAKGGVTWSRQSRAEVLLARGEIETLDLDMRALEADLARLGVSGREASLWKAMRAHFGAPLVEAERAALEALSAANSAIRGGGTNIQAVVPLYMVRREQGRLEELEAVLRNLAQDPASDLAVIYLAGLALIYAELQRPSDGRSALEQIEVLGRERGYSLEHQPRDSYLFIIFNALIAEACAIIGDTERSGQCYRQLLPYEHLNISLRLAFAGGSMARILGLLASTLGRWDEAERHFEVALEANERMGTPLWLAYTRYNYACMLLAHDDSADPARARELLDVARATADELGFIALRQKIDVAGAGG